MFYEFICLSSSIVFLVDSSYRSRLRVFKSFFSWVFCLIIFWLLCFPLVLYEDLSLDFDTSYSHSFYYPLSVGFYIWSWLWSMPFFLNQSLSLFEFPLLSSIGFDFDLLQVLFIFLESDLIVCSWILYICLIQFLKIGSSSVSSSSMRSNYFLYALYLSLLFVVCPALLEIFSNSSINLSIFYYFSKVFSQVLASHFFFNSVFYYVFDCYSLLSINDLLEFSEDLPLLPLPLPQI